MIRNVVVVMGVCVVLWPAVGPAAGQGPYVRPQTSPYARPAVSPYLNLLHGGNLAINYYGLVRPQQEFSNSIQEIHNEVHATQSGMINPAVSTTLPVTGHPTRFFSHGSYFFTHLGTGNRSNGTPTPGVVTGRPGTPVSTQR